MNAIILAAGEGKRLRPLTENIPKCMVKLFERSLLETQIQALRSCGVSDITVITGYKSNEIKIPGIKYIQNELYNETNMVETLFCGKEKFSDEMIVTYGDIVYERKILNKLIESKHEISIIVDKNWEEYWKIRFENPLDDAETLMTNSEETILEIGQKTSEIKKIQGQYIGLMKFQGDGMRKLVRFYEESKKNAENGVNPLNKNVEFKKSYMTDLLQGMIENGIVMKSIPIQNGWLEVDTITDFNTYTKLYDAGKLEKFYSSEE